MPVPTGMQSSFAPVNVAGALFVKTDTRTPLFNMLGGVIHGAKEFIVGSDHELGSAAQPAISETASLTAPEPTYDTPLQAKNVTEIHQKSVAISYRKMSNVDALTGLHLAGQANNVPSPKARAIANRLAEIRNDMEYTIINGVYALAANADQADKTRGLNAAVTTNVIDALGAELDGDMLVELARTVAAISPYGLDGLLGVLNAEQLVQVNKILKDEGQKESAYVGGTNLLTYITPFGNLRFLMGGHRYQVNGTAGFYNLGICKNVLQPVPEKGNFFYEALAKTGAAESGHIFGQWGLDHGMEWMHAKITNLATSTTASTAPKVFVSNDETSPVYTSAVSA